MTAGHPSERYSSTASVEWLMPDARMPLTAYWMRFRDAVDLHVREARAPTGAATLCVPVEDVAIETNWPRYGRPGSAYARGEGHCLEPDGIYFEYLQALLDWAANHPERTVLLVNMHPFVRLPLIALDHPNVVVADGSLATYERCLNPSTISMPALPIDAATAAPALERPVLASFQGVASHAVRLKLAELHDGRDVIVRIVPPRHHEQTRVDAEAGVRDPEYGALLAASRFAFVPRGDALFSYRLLEAMSYGCIPIVVSEGWVLPFDRTVAWTDCCVNVHHEAVETLVAYLRGRRSSGDWERRATCAVREYERCFASMDRIVDTLLAEAREIHDRRARR